jgi:glycosyltransferase involved in cell wall biosynthesis
MNDSKPFIDPISQKKIGPRICVGERKEQFSSVSKIVLTGDFLRFKPGTNAYTHATWQHGNILWLNDLLRGMLEDASGLPVELLSWTEEGGPLNVPELLKSAGHSADYSGWLATYNRRNPGPEEIRLAAPAFQDSIVVGYELTPYMVSLIEASGCIFYSLSIAPARYGPDLFFRIETNDGKIRNRIDKYLWSIDDLRSLADYTKAGQRRFSKLQIDENSALLCGQVAYDASLIETSRMVSMTEYFPEIEKLSDRHSKVYYKRHPHAVGDERVVEFIDRLPNGEMIDLDIYSLLSSPRIETVAAISSSVIFEAQLFGKRTVRFLKNNFDLGNGADALFVSSDCLLASFWEDLLGVKPASSRNYLRDVSAPIASALRSNWKRQPDVRSIADFPLINFWTPYTFGRGHEGANTLDAAVIEGAVRIDGRLAWAIKPHLTLQLRLPTSSAGDALIKLTIERPPMKGSQTLRFSSEGKDLGSIVIEEAMASAEIHIPNRLLDTHRRLVLQIEAERFGVPAEHEGGTDTQRLYFGLVGLEIIPADGRFPLWHGAYRVRKQENALRLSSAFEDEASELFAVTNEETMYRFRFRSRPSSDIKVCLHGLSCDAEQNPSNFACFVNGQYCASVSVAESDHTLSIHAPRGFIQEDGIFDISFRSSTINAAEEGKADDTKWTFEEMEIAPAVPGAPALNVGAMPGVAVIGQMRIGTGMGIAARNTVYALAEEIGERAVTAVNFNASSHIEFEKSMERFIDGPRRDLNIFLIPPPVMRRAVQEGLGAIWDGAQSVCYAAWELPRLPSHLADTSLFQHYWGISDFVRDAARCAGIANATTMPLSVDLAPPTTLRKRSDYGLPEGHFLFLFTYCIDSTLARKNPLAVIEAFKKAFPDRSLPVSLVLKCKVRQAETKEREAQEFLKSAIDGDPRIHIIQREMTSDEIKSLFMLVDAYISLHRAEGFGLTIAEAMGFGKPAIATAYSGNLQFMNSGNSMLTDFKLVEMDSGDYHNQRQHWAEADTDHASWQMRTLFENDVLRMQLARRGFYDIHSSFSLKALSRRLGQSIREIEAAQ